jgi:hypothetical protein
LRYHISSSLLRHHSQLKPIVVVLVLLVDVDDEAKVVPHVMVLLDVPAEACRGERGAV